MLVAIVSFVMRIVVVVDSVLAGVELVTARQIVEEYDSGTAADGGQFAEDTGVAGRRSSSVLVAAGAVVCCGMTAAEPP